MNLFYSNYFFHCSVIVDLAVVVVLLLVTPTGCVVFTGHHVQCTLWVSLQRAFTCIIVQKTFFNSISQAAEGSLHLHASRVWCSAGNRTSLSSCTLFPFLSYSSSALTTQICVRERRKETGRNTRPYGHWLLISVMWEKLQTERFSYPKQWRPPRFPSILMNWRLYERAHFMSSHL